MAKKRSKRRARAKAQRTTPQSFAKVRGFPTVQARLKIVVGRIVKEIIDEMNLSLMAVGKSFSPGALDEWKPKLTASVFTRLLNGGNWANDRARVLAVASDMALIGSILSGSAAAVNKGRVHASFRAVKDHATCPGSLGSGRWCDFDI
jgi:hypothetical protein